MAIAPDGRSLWSLRRFRPSGVGARRVFPPTGALEARRCRTQRVPNYRTRAQLRSATERVFGRQLSEVEWAAAEPDSAPPYDHFDVEDVLTSVRATSGIFEGLNVEGVLGLLGVPRGARLLVDYIDARAEVVQLISPPDDGAVVKATALSDQQFATIGRVVVAVTAASVLASQRKVAVDEVIRTLFGNHGPALLGPILENAVGALADSARHDARSGFGRALLLHWTDNEIKRALLEELTVRLEDPATAPGTTRRLVKRGNVPPVSAQQRWLVYQEEHAHRLGHNYKTPESYRKAVYRARLEVEAFIANTRV